MKRDRYTPGKIGIMALFVSLGIILQYIESRIMITAVPGGKLGLCNIVSIINIFMFGGKNAMVIALVRAFLGTFLSGGVTALPYSMAGALFSTLTMCLAKRYMYPKISMIGMSVIGASVHNLSQLCVAAVVLSSPYIFSYLPMLLLAAVASGIITGFGAQVLGNRILKSGDMICKRQ